VSEWKSERKEGVEDETWSYRAEEFGSRTKAYIGFLGVGWLGEWMDAWIISGVMVLDVRMIARGSGEKNVQIY
jgi:hypothetical protein